jgi:hypothetical protein
VAACFGFHGWSFLIDCARGGQPSASSWAKLIGRGHAMKGDVRVQSFLRWRATARPAQPHDFLTLLACVERLRGVITGIRLMIRRFLCAEPTSRERFGY